MPLKRNMRLDCFSWALISLLATLLGMDLSLSRTFLNDLRKVRLLFRKEKNTPINFGILNRMRGMVLLTDDTDSLLFYFFFLVFFILFLAVSEFSREHVAV